MRFVILSSCDIPGFGGIRGPLLTPQPMDLNIVRQLIISGIDIREVMEDNSYRELSFNDSRLLQAIYEGDNEEITEPEIPIIEQNEEYIEEEIKVSTIITKDVQSDKSEETSDEEEEELEDDELEEDEEYELDELEEME